MKWTCYLVYISLFLLPAGIFFTLSLARRQTVSKLVLVCRVDELKSLSEQKQSLKLKAKCDQ